MKRLQYIVVVMLVLVAMSTGALSQERASTKQESTATTETIRSIEGTTWAGKDSDGDYYEYTFLKGGKLRFRTKTDGSFKTYEDKGDEWAQNGAIVLMVMSKYTTRQGKIVDGRLQGDAWNVVGRRWTWVAEKK